LLLLILGLLAIWVACIVVGFIIKTLLWLAILGLVLFVLTGAGLIHHLTSRR
jgi:hypothetical protein